MVNDPYKLVMKGKGLSLKKKTNPHHTSKNSPDDSNKNVKKPMVKKPSKTRAEQAFEQAQSSKKNKDLMQYASKSHKEKVAEFNGKLSKLSEHYDIPKVGPG